MTLTCRHFGADMTTPPLANIEILILGPTPAMLAKLPASLRKVITRPEPESAWKPNFALEDWAQDVIANPDDWLPDNRDIFSSTELVALYDPFGEENVTPTRMANTFVKAGAQRAVHGRNITIGGRGIKYFALRNAEHWVNAAHGDAVAHILENPVNLD